MRNPVTMTNPIAMMPGASICAIGPVAPNLRNAPNAPYIEEERGRVTSVTPGLPHRIEIIRALWGSRSQADRVGRNQRKDRH